MYQAPTQIRPPAPPATQPAAPEIPLPPEPQSLEQTGLTLGFLSDLALKTLYLRGQMSMAEIASALGLPISNITERIMEFLKAERLVEIRGGTGQSEEHTSELQSLTNLVCRLLLEKKNRKRLQTRPT